LLTHEKYIMEHRKVLKRVAGTDLSRYNTLVMVNGNYGDLTERAKNDLKQWVRNGGTLITQRNAVNWAQSEGFFSLKTKERVDTLQRRIRPKSPIHRSG